LRVFLVASSFCESSCRAIPACYGFRLLQRRFASAETRPMPAALSGKARRSGERGPRLADLGAISRAVGGDPVLGLRRTNAGQQGCVRTASCRSPQPLRSAASVQRTTGSNPSTKAAQPSAWLCVRVSLALQYWTPRYTQLIRSAEGHRCFPCADPATRERQQRRQREHSIKSVCSWSPPP